MYGNKEPQIQQAFTERQKTNMTCENTLSLPPKGKESGSEQALTVYYFI